MWHRANHRPDDRWCLIDSIRPCWHEVADIVIDPTFAVDVSAAFEPSVMGIAVRVVAGERQAPARTAERPGSLPERRLGQGECPCAEAQGVEGDGEVRVVLEASVAPGSDERASHRDSLSRVATRSDPSRRFRVAPLTGGTVSRTAAAK